MKATFEFQLPEENDDYDIYRKAVARCLAIEEFSNYLRGVLKYETGLDKMSEADKMSALAVYETVREKWHEILVENGVSE